MPAGPHRLCKQKELNTNCTVHKADTNAEIVWKPAVVHKYTGVVQGMICMPHVTEQLDRSCEMEARSM